MKLKKITVILTLIVLPLFTACGANSDFDQEVSVIVALTQTATVLENPTVPATTESPPDSGHTGDYQPLSEPECSNLNMVLSQGTGINGTITSPVPFEDYVNETAGIGCLISIVTDGTSNNAEPGLTGNSILEDNGWIEDQRYGAAGIGGSVGAYRNGDLLCLTVNYVEPAEQAACEDLSFFECLESLPPEQILYGFELKCAKPAP